MKFKMIKLTIAALFLMGVSVNASAIVLNGNIADSTDVDYFNINIDATSDLTINVLAWGYSDSGLDSYIHLFETDLSGAQVSFNDDCSDFNLPACAGWDSDGSTSFLDSFLSIDNLGVGTYVLAIGSWFLSEEDARNGFNTSGNSNGGDYQITFISEEVASNVPAPSAVLLLATGILGVRLIRRRKLMV